MATLFKRLRQMFEVLIRKWDPACRMISDIV
jgi:hypothetical protein